MGAHHLVVLQHGLWGAAINLDYLRGLLAAHTSATIINSCVNELELTYQGIDACGDRLVELVMKTSKDMSEQGHPITHISFIGYSMGGLVTRHAIGKLHALGFFSHASSQTAVALNGRECAPEEDGSAAGMDPLGTTCSGVTPVYFITIATPHLGSWRLPSSWFARSFNALVPTVAARSGGQLMLCDAHAFDRPLLVNMSDPQLPFLQALALFQERILLANVFHDRTVPYCTASIRLDHPYDAHEARPVDPRFPSIVRPGKARARSRCAAAAAAKAKAVAVAGRVADGSSGGDAGSGRSAQGEQAASGACSVCATANTREHALTQDADDVSGEPTRLRPMQGLGIRIAALALLPLSLPLGLALFGYVYYKGRSHAQITAQQQFDHSWLTHHVNSGAARSGSRGKGASDQASASNGAQRQQQATSQQLHSQHHNSSSSTRAAQASTDSGGAQSRGSPQAGRSSHTCSTASDPAAGTSHSGAADAAAAAAALTHATAAAAVAATAASAAVAATASSQDHTHHDPAASRGPNASAAGYAPDDASALPAATAEACAAMRPAAGAADTTAGADAGDAAATADEEDVVIEVDGATREVVHIHDGIVETPGPLHEVQEWMASQLNALGWNKIDVDTRHYHAHAAIILRNPSRFMRNKDCLEYLVAQLHRLPAAQPA